MAAADDKHETGNARPNRRRRAVRRVLRLVLTALPVVLIALPGTLPGEAAAPARSDAPEEDDDWRATGADTLDIDRYPSDELALDEDVDDEEDAVGASNRAGRGGRSNSPVVNTLAGGEIPEVALRAYRRAEQTLSVSDPGCGIRWSLLAAIGRVESNHGRFGGAQLRQDGYGTRPIRGIPLDGRPGVATIRDTDDGALDGDAVYDRAVGPMQFIPSTWRSVAADGNGDGRKDPDNMFDAAVGAATYLCAGDGNLRNPQDRAAAVRRYNNSSEYVATVLALAARYESGQFGTLPDPGPASPVPPALPRPPQGPVNVGRPPGLEEVDPGGGGGPAPGPGPGPGGSGGSTSTATTAQPPHTWPSSTVVTTRPGGGTTITRPPVCPTTTTADPATTTTSTTTTTTLVPTTTTTVPPGCPTTTTTSTTTTTTVPSSTSSSEGTSSSSSPPSSSSP